MHTIVVERTIRAPIAEVFDWLTDATNYTRVPVVRRVTLLRPGDAVANGTGAIRVVTTPLLKLTEEVVEFIPPIHLGYRIIRATPPLRHEEGTLDFREVPDGTHIRWHTRYEVDSRLLTTLLTLAMHPVIAAGFEMVLRTAERELRK